jgi:hypothetical protein
MDRIRELSDASVPFDFEVHALFFSENAVGIEARDPTGIATHHIALRPRSGRLACGPTVIVARVGPGRVRYIGNRLVEKESGGSCCWRQ